MCVTTSCYCNALVTLRFSPALITSRKLIGREYVAPKLGDKSVNSLNAARRN